jgi:uncharacterized membrane protein YsdA (DUF1294 family)
MYNLGILILAGINMFAFIGVGIDKKRSRLKEPRLSEVWLLLWAVVGGALGVLLGMLFFHHKTRKVYWFFGISLLLIQQVVLFYWLFNKI